MSKPKPPLVERRTATTIPLTPLDASGYRKWRKRQSKATLKWLKTHRFEPRANRSILLPGTRGPKRALLGISDETVFSWAIAARRLPQGRYRIDPEPDAERATRAAIGWSLASYKFARYKSEPKAERRELVWPANADRAEVARLVRAIAVVRDLVNTPAEDLGPKELADYAVALAAEHGAKAKVIEKKALRDGFPAIEAVGRAAPSSRGPRLIDIVAGDPKHPKLTLVGKGVCFDSGGLNLKSTTGMRTMKKDMGGAAIVLGLMHLVLDARLPVRLRVLIPTVENATGPTAYRPSDVVRTRKGTSIEITNTDAEGRVILADAIFEGDTEQPDLLIDIATLTGSARYAVGAEITPFFTTSRKVADALAAAGREERDPVWRMPLHRGYRRHLDSHVADIKNSASTSMGGSIVAALFLAEFVEKATAWLHIDAFAWIDYGRPGRPIGGEATGLRALYRMLRDRYGNAEAE